MIYQGAVNMNQKFCLQVGYIFSFLSVQEKKKRLSFMFVSLWPCVDSNDVGGSPSSLAVGSEKVVLTQFTLTISKGWCVL